MSAGPVRLLLLGTGNMAVTHVARFRDVPDCTLVACADSVPGRAEAFASEHGIAHGFNSLDDAIAWGAFDAAINVTPDAAHHATTIRLIDAGRHVLCEKPLAPTHALALEMTRAAEAAGLINMVNLSYRDAAALQQARRLVDAGEIGELRHVEASYHQSWLVSHAWGHWREEPRWLWRLSTAHGSTGVLGDVGVHIIDFAMHGTGQGVELVSAELPTYSKAPGNRIGDYTLDANDSAILTVRFDGGAVGSITASRWATGHMNDLSLAMHGTQGAVKVTTDGRTSRLEACLGDDVHNHAWREVECPAAPPIARRFIDSVRGGDAGEPTFAQAARVQRVVGQAVTSSNV